MNPIQRPAFDEREREAARAHYERWAREYVRALIASDRPTPEVNARIARIYLPIGERK